MADDLFGLADLATINDNNLADIDVTDLLDEAPFLAALPATGASNGTTHKYLKETGAPVVGFRAVNDGREHDHSEDTLVTTNLAILDATFKADVAIASEYKDGGADGFINRELMRHLKAAFSKAEKQFFYGTTAQGDAAGFAGINDELDALADAMVSNATGTANLTSIYLVRAGNDDAVAVLGNDGEISALDPQIMEVAGATGTFPAWYVPVTGWISLQLGSLYSIHRIANVSTTEAGLKMTDDLVFAALAEFPSNKWPTHIVAHRYAVRDLRDSRTATNGTGTPAPWPTEIEGIPIIMTDSIRTDETAVV